MLKRIIYGLHALISEGKKPIGLSVDTTYRCNLKCKHCYFKKQKHKNELSVEEWLPILREWHRKGIIHCTWVGGEPLLRQELIEKGKSIFPFNWIVTNGTIPLPDWKDVTFFVSIDGPERIHDKIRGNGVYQRVKNNISDSKNQVCIGFVINRLNYKYINEFVEEWHNTPNVKGINFDFYTPSQGKKDHMWLNFEERDKVLEQIKELKKRYGKFILIDNHTLELLASKNCTKVTSDCPLKISEICLDPMGKRKLPCVMSGADCNRCGCISGFIWYSVFKNKNFGAMRIILRLLK